MGKFDFFIKAKCKVICCGCHTHDRSNMAMMKNSINDSCKLTNRESDSNGKSNEENDDDDDGDGW